MKRVLWALAFLTVLVAGGVCYQVLVPARSQTAVTRPSSLVPVTATTVAEQAMPVRQQTIGSVQTIASVTVKSRIDGVITEMLIRDGQFVKTGDIMIRLDSRAAEAQVHQADAQLAHDVAQLANARHDVERYAPLVAKDFVSHQQYDTAVTTAKALEASVAADQAALENARVLLSYDTISAPIDGRVGTIAIKTGNSLKANDVPLLTINQIMPIYVGFSLPQDTLPEIRTAMAKGPVTVEVVPAGDSAPAETGKLEYFDNAVDVNSGTIALKAVFANAQQRLWPGQFVNVTMTLRIEPDALVVPQAAVQAGQNSAYVFVITPENTAEFRPVTVSRTIAGITVIAKGLAKGERVAVDGQLRLSNGTKVDVRAAGAQPPAGPAS
jgi:multidrug efflux system membrane fusion protein